MKPLTLAAIYLILVTVACAPTEVRVEMGKHYVDASGSIVCCVTPSSG